MLWSSTYIMISIISHRENRKRNEKYFMWNYTKCYNHQHYDLHNLTFDLNIEGPTKDTHATIEWWCPFVLTLNTAITFGMIALYWQIRKNSLTCSCISILKTETMRFLTLRKRMLFCTKHGTITKFSLKINCVSPCKSHNLKIMVDGL